MTIRCWLGDTPLAEISQQQAEALAEVVLESMVRYED